MWTRRNIMRVVAQLVVPALLFALARQEVTQLLDRCVGDNSWEQLQVCLSFRFSRDSQAICGISEMLAESDLLSYLRAVFFEDLHLMHMMCTTDRPDEMKTMRLVSTATGVKIVRAATGEDVGLAACIGWTHIMRSSAFFVGVFVYTCLFMCRLCSSRAKKTVGMDDLDVKIGLTGPVLPVASPCPIPEVLQLQVLVAAALPLPQPMTPVLQTQTLPQTAAGERKFPRSLSHSQMRAMQAEDARFIQMQRQLRLDQAKLKA